MQGGGTVLRLLAAVQRERDEDVSVCTSGGDLFQSQARTCEHLVTYCSQSSSSISTVLLTWKLMSCRLSSFTYT